MPISSEAKMIRLPRVLPKAQHLSLRRAAETVYGEISDRIAPGPALVEVMTVRQELTIPPKVTGKQVAGFALWASRSVLDGDGAVVLEVARANLRQLAIE